MRGSERCGIWAHGATRGVVDTRRVGCAGFARVRGRTYVGVPGTWVRGRTWYIMSIMSVPGTGTGVPGTWYIMSARVYLVPTWVHEFASVPGTLECAVECAGVPVVHGTWDMGVECTWYRRIRCTRYTRTCTVVYGCVPGTAARALHLVRPYNRKGIRSRSDGVPDLTVIQEVISLHGPQSPMRI